MFEHPSNESRGGLARSKTSGAERAGRTTFAHEYQPLTDDLGGYREEGPTYDFALRAHRQQVLDGLQTLFGRTLARESAAPGEAPLLTLFASTVKSCLALRVPWSDCLEARLIHCRLNEAGAGVRVCERSERVSQLDVGVDDTPPSSLDYPWDVENC
ncbi:hypothetical protein [Amycolatopsis circi]|uniref:hypothetical protein n=1 Tax=Amycolatopsis circi TaxID=871959 RepID=UPI000E226672|nr:hypothetical protein [Amycolatopsis circi]